MTEGNVAGVQAPIGMLMVSATWRPSRHPTASDWGSTFARVARESASQIDCSDEIAVDQ